ncbi:MAG: rhomboid family intramembrane serine protease [Bacteroidales bacterium]|nr:rhomboid family intramembrane serine protease [Bacteroidales bacterium]
MDIKSYFKASMLNKLLVINVGVYLLISIAGIFTFLFGQLGLAEVVCTDILGLPAAPQKLLWRFWTPITYMFTHFSFWHILANMLWLYFMGQIFLMVFNNKQLFGLYILGGLSGALLYILSYNVFPVFQGVVQGSTCIGASAAVTAIVIAICVMRPNMEIRIFGIIPLTLKWLGILYVVFDVLQVSGDNSGGHIAHLGGAIFGAIFAWQYHQGKDLTKGFNNLMDKIVTLMPKQGEQKQKMRVVYNDKARTTNTQKSAEFDRTSFENQQRMDEILDKISQSGYNALTKEEKEFLFKMGRK